MWVCVYSCTCITLTAIIVWVSMCVCNINLTCDFVIKIEEIGFNVTTVFYRIRLQTLDRPHGLLDWFDSSNIVLWSRKEEPSWVGGLKVKVSTFKSWRGDAPLCGAVEISSNYLTRVQIRSAVFRHHFKFAFLNLYNTPVLRTLNVFGAQTYIIACMPSCKLLSRCKVKFSRKENDINSFPFTLTI